MLSIVAGVPVTNQLGVKPFGLLDTSNVNVIVLKFSNQNTISFDSYYKETHCKHDALDNFQTFQLTNEHIPSVGIQLGMLTMVKMKSHRGMLVYMN